MIKVLLVEDDVGLAHATEMALVSPPGKFKVIHAQNLTEARACLFNEPGIDVVLLDLMLGCEDGSVLLEEVKKRDGRLPVAILSGIDDKITIAQLYARGADDFIVKGTLNSTIAFQNRISLIVRQQDKYRALATAYGLGGDEGARTPDV